MSDTKLNITTLDHAAYKLLSTVGRQHVKPYGVAHILRRAIERAGVQIPEHLSSQLAQHGLAWGQTHNICVMLSSRAWLTLKMQSIENYVAQCHAEVKKPVVKAEAKLSAESRPTLKVKK